MKPAFFPVIMGGRRGSVATVFSPASLFTSGVVGAWYDPSDYSSLFQDSAGTTPVTAVEQPVGLMLDKSQGLVLGPEVITNGNFSDGSTGWTSTGTGWAIGSGIATHTGTVSGDLTQASLTVGKTYKITATITGTGATVYLGDSTNLGQQTGSFSAIATCAGSTTLRVRCPHDAVTIDNISVKELPGNHASQATSASRPILRARYNLLTYSEQFNNAAWSGNRILAFGSGSIANATTAPDGTVTADLLTEDTATGVHYLAQTVTTVGVTYARSVYAKTNGRSISISEAGSSVAKFNLSNGTVISGTGAAIFDAGSGWYRCTFSSTAVYTSAGINIIKHDGTDAYTGDGTSGIYVWGADVRAGSSAGTYQRIAAATDYDTAGFLPYLATDGTDDTLSSGNIDLTGTSKLSAVVGATKNNDSNVYAIVDFGASGSGTAGGFSMWAGNPASGGAAVWASSFQSSAGGVINIVSPTNFAAPATGVVTTILDTVAAGSYLRVNGALQTTSATDPTDGTFGNLPLRLSRSGANGLPGRIYQLVVVGKTLSASELASTESFVATKTGVTL
jgi:hypothetical protein